MQSSERVFLGDKSVILSSVLITDLINIVTIDAAKPDYEEKEIKLYSGDYILFMTDGVVEARNSKKESFGYERVHHIILENNKDVLEILDNELENFNDGEQTDDISMLLINIW